MVGGRARWGRGEEVNVGGPCGRGSFQRRHFGSEEALKVGQWLVGVCEDCEGSGSVLVVAVIARGFRGVKGEDKF